MCLIVNQPKLEFQIADHDITCYKMVMKYDNGEYRTAYQHVRIPRLCMWGWKKFRAGGPIDYYQHTGDIIVNGGLIHTFEIKESAMGVKDDKPENVEIWECIIPKGEKYVRGKFKTIQRGNHYSYYSLGSKSIRFVKKIY